MGKWTAILILASAQFVMVLDSSVMNVSISQIVEDLDTTIEGVQLAITAYTLVMAAFMLLGAKLGDIWGRDRAFAIGLAIYGAGSLTTSVAPNLPVLLFGWSFVEGIGAVLVIPAIAALIATNYEGKDRALAYGIIGGIAAAAVAAGPLIGGWVTTTFTWRLVFAAETVVVVGILLVRKRMKPSPRVAEPPALDLVGAALSALGLALVVLAVLQSSSWGWILPKDPPEVAGHEVTPFGLSVVPFMVLAGLGVLWAFRAWEGRLERLGRDRLLDFRLLDVLQMRAGLSTMFVLQVVIMGIFFALPIYLQVILGLDAFETGKRLIPMSVMMLLFALAGPRAAARRSPRTVARIGFGGLALGATVVLATLEGTLTSLGFSVGLAIFGAGAGLVASQVGNVIMSSVGQDRSNEAGGLQGTAQNLGASMGTAIIGSVLLTFLAAGFVDNVLEDPTVPAELQATIETQVTANGLEIVPVAEFEAAAAEYGLPPDQIDALSASYAAAELDAVRVALAVIALTALLGLWTTRRIPTHALGEAPPEAAPIAG
jgi:MFS family permease